MSLRPAASAAAIGAAAALATLALNGCQGDCCTVDSFPILLARAASGTPPVAGGFDAGADAAPLPDGGALWAVAGLAGAGPDLKMVVDTATPFTILGGTASGGLQTSSSGFDLYSNVMLPAGGSPVRARFRNWDVLTLPLHGVGDGTLLPDGVLGGDLLRGYSVEFRFAAPCAQGTCASMTLWNRLGANQAFLEDAGFAVLGFTLYGGGEVTVNGDPDFLGLRGPLAVSPSRIVLRACAVPAAFSPALDPAAPDPPACCNPADALSQATGADLSLLLDTGIAPLVLGASAWSRVVANAAARNPPLLLPALASAAGPSPTPLYVATWPVPVEVLLWAAIPRYALVNLEAGSNNDPGPCVELARSRRTEVVSWATLYAPERHLCGQPCDLDPNQSGETQNSAAYLEISGTIPVAVISDDDPFLQGLRFDVLPEGPEIDGLIGAQALGRSRLELDYRSTPGRAVFSCEPGDPAQEPMALRGSCWAAARCPQLPDRNAQHYCFNLPLHGLPESCAPSACSR